MRLYVCMHKIISEFNKKCSWAAAGEEKYFYVVHKNEKMRHQELLHKHVYERSILRASKC